MKRLLIISFVLLLSGIVFAGPPAIPPKDLIEVSANCNQSQYYVLGKVCQSSVDGKLYKGDGNQIIELAAGTSEGDMLGAFYASEGRIRPLRGGTGIDSSGLSGFPLVTSGVWSVLNNAGVKSALGYLTSTDYPVTGVASPTAGMIPKWGVSGNTLVDGYDVTAFQAALTNPVTGVASPSAGYLTKWGLSGNSIVDGLKIGTMTDGKVCTFSDTDGMECDTTITGGGSMVYPSAGIPVSTGEGWGSPATYSNITGLWASGACSGYLKSDGSCDTPQGGGGYTNLTSFVDQTAWRLFYSDSSGDVKELALGTNGQYLMSNGASSVPSWGTPAGGGFDVTGSYSPTGTWNWSGVNAATTWPTFNQSTTGNAATATTATTATNLSSYAVLYDGAVTDGHIVKYDDTTKKLKDAGAAVGYTEPQSNLPLCRTGSGAVGACTNLTDVVVPQGGGGGYTNLTSFVSQTPWRLFYSNTSGVVTELALGVDGQYLKSNGASAAPTWDTPQGGGNGIDYTPPEDPAPLCSDETGAIVACTNLKDEDLAEIEGSADDIGVKVETISEDPEAVIECEGKDRNYIVGFDGPSFFQLPANPSGIRYCFGNNDYGKVISIVPDGSDTITHEGTATTSGQGLVSGGDEEDWVCLLGLNSNKWRTISYLGTWNLASVTLPEPEEPGGETPSGDIFAEGFETQGYDLEGWSATGTVDPDYSLAGLNAPEGNGDYGLYASSEGTVSYVSLDVESGPTAHFGKFSFYVDTHDLAVYSNTVITSVGNHATFPLAEIAGSVRLLVTSQGALQVYGAGATDSGKINIDVQEWNEVTYCMTSVGGDSDPCGTGSNGHGWVSIDGGSTKETFECNENAQRYFRYGVLTGSQTLDIVFGYVTTSSTGGD